MQRTEERKPVKKPFATFFSPGPTWIAGKTSREQLCWTEHAAFMEKLFEDGTIVLGGPYVGYTGPSSSLKLSMRKKCLNSSGMIRSWYMRLCASAVFMNGSFS